MFFNILIILIINGGFNSVKINNIEIILYFWNVYFILKLMIKFIVIIIVFIYFYGYDELFDLI